MSPRRTRDFAVLLVSGAFSAACLAVYLAYLTRNYYWDGVLFALDIETARRRAIPFAALLHPNHLLYCPFGFALFSAARVCGSSARAIDILAIANSVLSAAVAAIVYAAARKLTASAPAAFFSELLLAFGATWWKFSTDADAYIASVFCCTLAVMCAIQSRNVAIPALFSIAAMLLHELAVFACIPVFAALLLNATHSFGRRTRDAVLYLTTAAAATLAIYFACYRIVKPRFGFFAWITTYASSAQTTHSAARLAVAYPLSFSKLFVGGRLALLRDYLSTSSLTGLAVCVLSLITFFALLRRTALWQPLVPARTFVVLWLWFIPYAIFLAWFEPSNAFYKLFLWPPLVLLLGIFAARAGKAPAAIALALAIAGWNFAAYIYPHAHASAEPILAFAKRVDRELPPNATIYYAEFSPDDWYLDYFAPGRNWLPLPMPPRTLSGNPVCLETTALASGARPGPPMRVWALTKGGHYVQVECFQN
jgi:hypothetical protein